MLDIHLDFLRIAADDAGQSESPEARARLYPKPLGGKEELINEDYNEEWKELVTSELEMQFAGDVGIYLSDLDSIQPVKKSKAARKPAYQLDVPLEHGRAWFSTLNQARLLLDLRYKLHSPQDSSEQDPVGGQPDAESDPARLLVLMRYEFYAWIQEWLVRHVLPLV